MRIVSWNMGMGPPGGRHQSVHHRAWHYLLGLGPDLAFLQEAFPPTWVRTAGTLVQGPITRWGSAIFSPRYPLERHRVLEGSHLHALGDYLAFGLASLPDGSEVFLASVHAVAREASQAQIGMLDPATVSRQSVGRPWVNDVVFAGLEEMVRGRRFIAAGDWNTARLFDAAYGGTAGAEFFDRAREHGWVECARKLHPEEVQTWFRAGNRPYQLDHVFCDPALGERLQAVRVAAEAATELGLSDHAPLVLDFEVQPISMTSLAPQSDQDDDPEQQWGSVGIPDSLGGRMAGRSASDDELMNDMDGIVGNEGTKPDGDE
jgi:endonuclease/exonuclease/phosphatase family metal-dependent hydrolase